MFHVFAKTSLISTTFAFYLALNKNKNSGANSTSNSDSESGRRQVRVGYYINNAGSRFLDQASRLVKRLNSNEVRNATVFVCTFFSMFLHTLLPLQVVFQLYLPTFVVEVFCVNSRMYI